MIHQVLRFLGYVHLYMHSLLDLLGCPFSGSLVPLLSSFVLGGVLAFAFRRPLLLLLPLVFVPPRVLVVLVPVPVVLGPPPVAVVAVVLVLAFSFAVSTLLLSAFCSLALFLHAAVDGLLDLVVLFLLQEGVHVSTIGEPYVVSPVGLTHAVPKLLALYRGIVDSTASLLVFSGGSILRRSLIIFPYISKSGELRHVRVVLVLVCTWAVKVLWLLSWGSSWLLFFLLFWFLYFFWYFCWLELRGHCWLLLLFVQLPFAT